MVEGEVMDRGRREVDASGREVASGCPEREGRVRPRPSVFGDGGDGRWRSQMEKVARDVREEGERRWRVSVEEEEK